MTDKIERPGAPTPAERGDVDTAFLRAALASGDRWHSRVRSRPLLLSAILATTATALLFAFVDGILRNLPQPQVIVTLAMMAAIATAVLLWLRTDVLDDTRIGWVAPGYVAAGLLMLLSIEQTPDVLAAGLARDADPAGASQALNRAFALHLAWHLAFAGAALGALLLERRTILRRVFLGGVLALGLSLATGEYPSQLALVELRLGAGSDPLAFTSLYWSLSAATLVMLTGAAIAWFVTVGPRPPVARAWIGVSVALVAIELALHVLAGSVDGRFFMAAVVMQALAFLVSLGGQVLGIRSTIAGQFAFEADVASRYAAGTVLDSPAADARPPDLAITGDDLRAAIHDGNRLQMHLQPIVRIEDGAVTGFEALARFGPTATGAQVAPDVWFDAAHRQGIGLVLELAAVKKALALLPTLPEGTRLSINVGPATLVGDPLLHLLEKCDASRVTVELTEHARVDDYAAMAAALDRLRMLGTKIAVDDAGAGFSSLRHITRLGPDVLKVDISLIRNVDRLPLSRAMVAALVAYARRAGTALVAEGVEDRDEAVALWSLGVEFGQGWHWARAMAPQEAVTFRFGQPQLETS